MAEINSGNPFVNYLDATGSFSYTLPLLGVTCPLGLTLDSVPVEFDSGTSQFVQAGLAKTTYF